MKDKHYKIKYRILDEPGIRELYHGVSATSVTQATDRAEKMLISDGLKFSSFEIVEVRDETIQEHKTVKFKIRQDKEFDEWIVEVRINGKLNEAKSYHADSYEDAQNTRCGMVMEAKEHPERY